MSKSFIKRSVGDNIFDTANYLFMLIACFVTIYPIWYITVLSFNDGNDAIRGGIYWWPRVFSLDNYETIFQDARILQAFFISFSRTAVSTLATVLFTAMAAYAWLKKRLIGRKLYMGLGAVTLFFNGGLIPTFLLILSLGLFNNFMVYVIPTLFAFFNLIIFQAFFGEIPEVLEEAAMIEGAHEFGIFVRIILPLSKPVLATIALFHGVWSWNDFFMGVIYIKDDVLQPIATVLYGIVRGVAGANMANLDSSVAGSIALLQNRSVTSTSVQLATMIVATFPIVVTYPFLQKYFIKGLLIGSVKG